MSGNHTPGFPPADQFVHPYPQFPQQQQPGQQFPLNNIPHEYLHSPSPTPNSHQQPQQFYGAAPGGFLPPGGYEQSPPSSFPFALGDSSNNNLYQQHHQQHHHQQHQHQQHQRASPHLFASPSPGPGIVPQQQGHLAAPNKASLHPYAAAYAADIASPAAVPSQFPHPVDLSPQPAIQWPPLQGQHHQQGQQQQQQQQQLFHQPSPQPQPQLQPQPQPSPQPSTIEPPPDNGNGDAPVAPVRKITLRIPSASTSNPDMPKGRSSRAAVPVSAVDRPRRSRAATKVNYALDENSDDGDFVDPNDEEDEEQPEREPVTPQRGRATRSSRRGKTEDDDDYGTAAVDTPQPAHNTRRSSRTAKAPERYADADDFEDKMLETSPAPEPPRPAKRKGRYIPDPDEDDEELPPAMNGVPPHDNDVEEKPRSQRSRGARHSSADAESFAPSDSASPSPSSSPDPIADDYVEEEDDMRDFIESPPRRTRQSIRSAPRAAPTRRITRNSRRNDSEEDEAGGRRNLRKRNNVNYTLPPIDMTAELAAAERQAEAMNQAMGAPRTRGFGFGAMRKLPWMNKPRDTTAQAQVMGDPDSSDSDDNLQIGPSRGAAPGGPNVPGPTDVPNYGRFNPKSSTADADPLGVDVNVTFDRVGGLDHHINQLKEMVALPLLYPELFKQFGIIPPRGVLFHGPPGTGKTLLARALAASCSNGNTKISFFMRKGADVLSKWVGEAERQLRMLFEEARASQPSIIFFDEIDGLAPVRSSKQDQIHASLVSTLLALMDGMDGRGQVIVIGATNRPDAVDPALRRPGRFDREFYFPLPNLDARRQIIKINTRDWSPQLPDDMLDTLAVLTKGYGGADLRALSTEAALNAIQRRYPQIYKTNDRLQVEPGSIHVQPKDFMLAVKKIIPSSARSASSAAIQLPKQLVPLLADDLEKLKTAVDRALPPIKKRTALEEAEFEDDEGDTFEKELMLQSLDKLRTYRPRLIVYGPCGSGQTYLGPAILHHLEGFHVQTFDLATLMSDSTRTTEAAIVQLFVEAKRHQPSIIFIPSLGQWCATVSETARATTRALLDGIPPSDPVLLLAIVDGPLNTLPPDVRAWFGYGTENRVQLGSPSAAQRKAFFADLLSSIERKPTEFPDGVPRKKRVLEVLPLAEPLPPRQPTEAEIARDLERDAAARNMITLSFSALVSELAKKYRRPVALAKENAFGYLEYLASQAGPAAPAAVPEAPGAAPLVEGTDAPAVPPVAGAPLQPEPVNGGPALMEISGEAPVAQLAIVPPNPPAPPAPVLPPLGTQGTDIIETFVSTEPSLPGGAPHPVAAALARDAVEGSVQPSEAPSKPEAHNMDIDIMQQKLIKHKYHTPGDFLADIYLIEENAKFMMGTPEHLKIVEMCAYAKSHVQTFDPKWNPEFERYALRMRERKAERKAKREKERAEAEAKAKEKEGQAEGGANGEASGSLKRAREDEDAGGPAKRARDDMEVDPIESLQNGTQLTVADSIVSIPTSPAADAPSKDAEPEAKGPEPKEPTPKAPTQSPSPPPVYPPFTVPRDKITALSSTLTDDTGSLCVEELEQLRAALLDCVWRSRTQWDRTHLLDEMVRLATRFIDEVAEVRE